MFYKFTVTRSRNNHLIKLFVIGLCYLSVSLLVNAQKTAKDTEQNFGAIDPFSLNSGVQFDMYPGIGQFKSSHPISKGRTANNLLRGLDPTLNAAIDAYPGSVRSAVMQPDGKILIGGYFKTFNGVNKKSLLRLNTDNSIDIGFGANINGTVLAIAVQSDGKIVIGGSFTAVNGTTQNNIARLNSDGTLDTTFNTGFGTTNTVNEVLIQPDGKILIGGSFVGVASFVRVSVARLNGDGSIDTTFNSPIPPTPSSGPQPTIYSMALQPDGKIILGGAIILSINPTLTVIPVTRLNTDGTFDASFNVQGNITTDTGYKVQLQPDGKILLGGFFTRINGVTRRCIARLNADGSIDTSFDPGAGASAHVFSILRQADGKIIIGGLFTSVNGISRSRLARINENGSLDDTFNPDVTTSGAIYSMLFKTDGKILAGGLFTQTSDTTRDTLSVFNLDGTLFTPSAFSANGVGGIRAIAQQPDGKLIVGGTFSRINGLTRNRIARLNPDGTIDNTFSQIAASEVNALLLQPDGKILAGGSGLPINGGILPSIVRLNSDGTLDTTFTQSIGTTDITSCKAMAMQSDGKILFSYTVTSTREFQNERFSRLNADGSLDSTFNTTQAIGRMYEAIVPLADGKILVGGPVAIGYVTSGQPTVWYYGIYRLNADGSHDRDFRAGLLPEGLGVAYVYAISLQQDGKILIGGRLYTANQASPSAVVRLNADGTVDETFQRLPISSTSESPRVEDLQVMPDGKVVIGGRFNSLGSSTANNVARLNSNGTLDDTFQASADNVVFDVAIQTDGKALIGGDFESVNNTARTSLARFLNEPVTQHRTRFDFDGDGKTDISIFRPVAGEWWYQRSSDNQVPAVQFGSSTDKLVPEDFTGDGKTDVAYFRPSTGEWFILRSENLTFYAFPFGVNGDVPVPADYDGDGQADAAVFRPSTATWFINKSTGGVTIRQFGLSGDIPVVSDYDGDGKADVAIFRPSGGSSGQGEWWIDRSTAGLFATPFGESGDKPVSADYTGDGKSDAAFWRPSSGEWFVLRSEDLTFYAAPFGANGDVPVAGDYDGDGKADLAVYRPSGATWFVSKSGGGTLIQAFGVMGDIAVPSAFIP